MQEFSVYERLFLGVKIPALELLHKVRKEKGLNNVIA
jgi:hypothetical protein